MLIISYINLLPATEKGECLGEKQNIILKKPIAKGLRVVNTSKMILKK
jgi:hypothetical protein